MIVLHQLIYIQFIILYELVSLLYYITWTLIKFYYTRMIVEMEKINIETRRLFTIIHWQVAVMKRWNVLLTATNNQIVGTYSFLHTIKQIDNLLKTTFKMTTYSNNVSIFYLYTHLIHDI